MTARPAQAGMRLDARSGVPVVEGGRLVTPGAPRVASDGPLPGVQSIRGGDTARRVEVALDQPIRKRGTISFWMRTDRHYRNGPGARAVRRELLGMPGVGKCYFVQGPEACLLGWDWDWDVVKGVDWLGTYIPELPGPEWYHLIYTWDSEKGLFDAYLNGTPQRVAGIEVKPWSMAGGSALAIYPGPIRYAEVRVKPEYTAPDRIPGLIPTEYLGRRADLIGGRAGVGPLRVQSRKGRLVYQSDLASESSIAGWVMEGPGVVSFSDGWMQMSSRLVDGEPKGHIVHWCPQEMPGNFVAEWDVRFVSENGLNIVFLAAKGRNGESALDPSLPERDGTFRQYTSGALDCYHISYYAHTPGQPGRPTSNLRKNHGFYLVSNGPPGIPPGSTRIHRVRLIKDGAHIQCQVDGRPFIDYMDDGSRFGPVLRSGCIGLRQMEWSVTRYRDLRVWELGP